MPVYEYQCSGCGHIEEVFQKISESPLDVCPRCNGKLKKIVSQSTFHLKGSGWYVTDYGGAKAGSKPKEASSTKSEKSASKSDSK
ncbi:FmdB family zinc ribbon protein [Desulfobacter latus]|uniref:Zinc ribbon domain-containing protein n=1 Tax=Desulfobacter latus TaxID=2292 RepID=A0A850T4J6_9BACT|nr:FmdB family zinc ribbon protein [Desulfobacter latus]NWH06693.1 zinc ribbon domain-containing protein [Desulfobacter latus]